MSALKKFSNVFYELVGIITKMKRFMYLLINLMQLKKILKRDISKEFTHSAKYSRRMSSGLGAKLPSWPTSRSSLTISSSQKSIIYSWPMAMLVTLEQSKTLADAEGNVF